jgi:hypothetical protein
MGEAVNITGATRVDKEKFLKVFSDTVAEEVDALLLNLKKGKDRDIVKDVAMKMMALYQKMYLVETERERESVQRQLNNYKSAVAAISARYELDIANTIIRICKKSSAVALSAAVSFVAL